MNAAPGAADLACCGGVDGACWLDVAVMPNAKRTVVDGLHDGALRVRLAAPPVDGKANDALVKWLAGELGLPRRAVTLVRGQASRRKRLAIELEPALLTAWVRATLSRPA